MEERVSGQGLNGKETSEKIFRIEWDWEAAMWWVPVVSNTIEFKTVKNLHVRSRKERTAPIRVHLREPFNAVAKFKGARSHLFFLNGI